MENLHRNMKQKPVICLSFDVEEFDLPLEYKQHISNEKQIEITSKGMEILLPLFIMIMI